jgi:hypothetical protein
MVISTNRFHEKGGTDVPVTDGGTNASTSAAARTNLGITVYDSTTHASLNHESIASVLSPTEHAAIDHSLIENRPTPAGWGNNRQVLTGNLTLLNTSPAIQFLDPDGVERYVFLPAVSTANPMSIIFNIGVVGCLIISAPDGALLCLEPAQGTRIYTDGLNYAIEELGDIFSILTISQTYPFGGRINLNGDYLWAKGKTDDTPTGADVTNNYHPATRDGTLLNISWISDTLQDGNYFTVRVNSVVTGFTGTLYGFSGVTKVFGSGGASSVVSVNAGDSISMLEAGNGTLPQDINVTLGVHSSGGQTYCWGGDPGGVGAHFVTNELAGTSIGTPGINQSTEHTVVSASTAVILGYTTQSGNGTTQLKLVKNGVVAETFFIAAGTGVVALSTAFSAGDTIAVEYDAGTAPADATVVVELITQGQLYFFGGNTGATSAFYKVNAISADAVTSTTFNQANSVNVMHSGTLKVSWRSAGTGTGQFQLVKDGVSAELFGNMATTSGVATLTTTVRSGDKVGIREGSGAGTDAGATTLILAVEQ